MSKEKARKKHDLGARLSLMKKKFNRLYDYVTEGVWSDQRKNVWVNMLKTANLSVRCFLDVDLQGRAASLTYNTILAIVPALALIFAIGRGFGLQDILEQELAVLFPAQKETLNEVFGFVDSYLSQSSEGVFVGIGILFLLWTLVSLLSNVEAAFNKIWNLKQGRSIARKLTDYTAIFLLLPVLMICASGLMFFMTTTLKSILPFEYLTPLVQTIIDFTSIAMIWLFFTGSYMLIPNTRVRFKNAIIAGIFAGTAYMILQWLFVSGQLYVTRYNAIYGSFALLPLLLLWLQLVWAITLSGAVLCYSAQNIFEYSFSSEISKISANYRWQVTVAVMRVAIERFNRGEEPLTAHAIAVDYGLPILLVSNSVHTLEDAHLVSMVKVTAPEGDEMGVAPAIDPSKITLGLMVERLNSLGASDFIPQFGHRFSSLQHHLDAFSAKCIAEGDNVLISDMPIHKIINKKR